MTSDATPTTTTNPTNPTPPTALSSLSGSGTFPDATVSPPTDTPVAVSASGAVGISPGAAGYLVAIITDQISGLAVAGIADIIRASDVAAGSKNFSIECSGPQFTDTASLVVSVSTRALDTYPNQTPATAPVLPSATLNTFSASAA